MDVAVCALAAAMIGVGLVMNFSTAGSLLTTPLEGPLWRNSAVRQSIFSLAALVVLLCIARVDYRGWLGVSARSLARPAALLALGLLLCLAALVPGIGVERNGARRWLPVGAGVTVQPSELCKAMSVILLAAMIALRRTPLSHFWRGLLPALLVIAVCVGVVGKEDFGTSALIGLVGGALLLAGGAKRWHLALCALPAVSGMAALVYFWPYRMERLLGFLDIWKDPQGRGYHPVQSLVTIASGEWWGLGLGAGVQKYGYLPEARSDFVFSVVVEELGVVGGLIVIALYAAMVVQGWRIVRRAPDTFGRLLAFGATMTLGVQAVLNIGVVTVMLPTKGISLPFISAGGSSMLFLSILVGSLAAVGRQCAAQPVQLARPIRAVSVPQRSQRAAAAPSLAGESIKPQAVPSPA